VSETNNIFSEFDRMLGRGAKESQLKQKGHVFWLYGLSGSGKSTIADKVERSLVEKGHYIKLLDGDNVRTGLNKDLGFTDADRAENIRRIAEVARLFLDAGFVVITSFISPLKEYRNLAESIIVKDDFTKVYINTSFSTCSERDVKGLYAKAKEGGVAHFTGKDSLFEAPSDSDEDWILDTEQLTVSESTQDLVNKILPIIKKT
jgi:adenylylsulfate kinase